MKRKFRIFIATIDNDAIIDAMVELKKLGLFEQPNILISHYFYPTLNHLKELKASLPSYADPLWFLDSGAYSSWTSGATIRINDYLAWVKGAFDILGRDRIHTYANLDVIRNPVLTLRNQRVIERSGFRPLPVIHSTASVETMEQIVEEYDTFAVGGLVGGGSNGTHYTRFLKGVFDKAATKHGNNHSIHGFGVTSYPIISRFPFNSVDSSSWMAGVRWGAIRMFDPRICKVLTADLHDTHTDYAHAIELISSHYPYSMKELKEQRRGTSRGTYGRWRTMVGVLLMLSYRYMEERVRKHQNEV